MPTYKVPVLSAFSWQPPVLAVQNAPPGTPAKGDRYIVAGSPTGDWVGHAWSVATYNGTGWDFDVPSEGWAAWDVGADNYKHFNGTAWTSMPVGVHATTHQLGGSDAIKLDDLAAPDDNTDLDASTAKHGLLKKLGGGTTNFLRADGTWAAPPGPSTPTGTGFRHVTAGVEDAAAKLVENADVHASAGIVESKLSLNFATHSNTNDPTADQKSALAGTHGTPSGTNKYVTNSDPRLPVYDADYKCLLMTV